MVLYGFENWKKRESRILSNSCNVTRLFEYHKTERKMQNFVFHKVLDLGCAFSFI